MAGGCPSDTRVPGLVTQCVERWMVEALSHQLAGGDQHTHRAGIEDSLGVATWTSRQGCRHSSCSIKMHALWC